MRGGRGIDIKRKKNRVIYLFSYLHLEIAMILIGVYKCL
jgi:hypothetical protein